MTDHDAFDADVGAWLDGDAQTAIPAAARDQVLAVVAGRRPRPGRLAGIGSHWVADGSAGSSSSGNRHIAQPVLRSLSAILVLLLTLALIGAAVFVSGRLPEDQPGLGRLVYQLDGHVYLADSDGGDPIRVTAGASLDGIEANGYSLSSGSTWAPDGRHLLFLGSVEAPAYVAAVYIGDAEGRIVASIAARPGSNNYPVWSPDSTRLHMWTDGGVSIFGIDGVLQATLPLPVGYERLGGGISLWAPDGRSVWVWIRRHQTLPCNVPVPGAVKSYDGDCVVPEAWELPIDGSTPRLVAQDLRFQLFDPSSSPDGTRMTFSGSDPVHPGIEPDNLVYVANRDGTDIRAIIQADKDPNTGRGMFPAWSPRGDLIAYLWTAEGDQISTQCCGLRDLRVVDLATGITRSVITRSVAEVDAYPHFGWSAAGDALLYAALGDQDEMSLWSVGTEGGTSTLLVKGATQGAWQPPVAP